MSQNLWNIKDLEAPPITTCKIFDKKIDLKELKSLLSQAIETFSDQTTLEDEAALLSRTIYRMKLKLRKDKGFKHFEKVKRALFQYLRLEHFRILETFSSVIPEKYDNITYFPSQNMLDYVLVRTQGVTKLLARIAECALETGYYMQKRLYQGDYMSLALIAFAIASRIFSLTKYLVKFSCNFYNELICLRKDLVNTASSWLNEDYEYPKNLNDWLGVDWMDDKFEMKPIVHKSLRFDYCDDSDIEYAGEYMDLSEELEVTDEYVQILDEGEVKTKVKRKKKMRHADISEIKVYVKDEDVGEVFNENNIIEVDSGQKEKINRNDKKEEIHGFINRLNHIDDVHDFMKKEKLLREDSFSNCSYNHLIEKDWLNLYYKVEKQLEEVKNIKKGKKIRNCLEKIKEELRSNL